MASRLMYTLFLILFISGAGLAQSNPRELAEQFFSTYTKDPLKAVDQIFATNEWYVKNEDGVKSLKNKLSNTIDLLGAYYGYEELTQASAGKHVAKFSYMVLYDRQPLRFTFLFYKVKEKWRLNNFGYEESFSEELDEAMKVYRLPENQ